MKYLKKFESFQNPFEVVQSIVDDIKSSETIEELKEKVDKYNLNKGNLMNITYNGDTKNVDSATPKNVWSKLNEFEPEGTFWFVMDYKDGSHGKLVHLGEKILGKELTDWNEKLD